MKKQTNNKIASNGTLTVYGITSNIIKLINKTTDVLPDHLNWQELACLYFYAPQLKEHIKPWMDKIQKHFAQNDSEVYIIITLATEHKELEHFLLEEIVHIKHTLILHDFGTLFQLFPKLDRKNKKIAMLWILNDIQNESNPGRKKDKLTMYHEICTSKNEKSDIVDQIVKLSSGMTVHYLKEVYKKIPDQRIEDLWFKALDQERPLDVFIDAALMTKKDAFFEKAKMVKIYDLAPESCRMLGEKYEASKDVRVLDVLMYVIEYFYGKKEPHIITYAIDAFALTKDIRFFDFAKKHSEHFDSKLKLYWLKPDSELLESMKLTVKDFRGAKEGLLATGDDYFLTEVKKHISVSWESSIDLSIHIYRILLENPNKNKQHIKDLKKFIEDNLGIVWTHSRGDKDKEVLLEMLAS